MQAHAAHLRLVVNIRGVDLHGYRQTDTLRHDQRFRGGPGVHAGGDGDLECAQQRLGLDVAEYAAPLAHGVLYDQARPGHIRHLGFRQRRRRLQQDILVAVIGRQVAEAVHPGLGGGEPGYSGGGKPVPGLFHQFLPQPAGQHRFAAIAGDGYHTLGAGGGVGHRLGREQHQQAIDIVIGQQYLRRRVIALAGGVPQDVNGNRVGPVLRQYCAELVHCRPRELGQRHLQVRRPIRGHDPRAAAVGEYRQAGAAHAGARGQGLGGRDQLAGGGDAHRAGAANRRVKDLVATHIGAGVGDHGPVADFTAPGLDHNDGLDARRNPQAADKRARVRHTLDVQQDALGLRVQRQVVQHLAETHIRGGAQRGHRGETEAVGFPPVHHGGTECAGLGHQRHMAGGHAVLGEARIEAHAGPHDAQAVGADQGYFVGAGDVDYGILQGASPGADLRKAGGYDDGGTDAGLAALVQHTRNRLRRDNDDHQVDGVVYGADGGVALQAAQFLVARIDRVDLALEAAVDNVVQQLCAHRPGTFGGAHDGHGLRFEYFVKQVLSHCRSSAGSSVCAPHRELIGPGHCLGGAAAQN